MPWIKIDRWIAKCDGCGEIFKIVVPAENELVPYALIEFFADRDSDALASEAWTWVKTNDKVYCPEPLCVEKMNAEAIR